MSNYNQYDSEYRRVNPQFSNNIPVNKFYRNPGLDAGTFLWPLLMGAIFIISALLVQILAVVYKVLTDSNFKMALETAINQGGKDLSNLITKEIFSSFLISALIYSLIQILIYGLFLRWRNRREEKYVLTKAKKKSYYILVPIVTIGAVGLTMAWMLLINYLGSKSEFWSDQFSTYEQTTSLFNSENTILMIVSVCILVPIAEELLFRGVILSELRRVMPAWIAVVLSSIVFGIAHGNLIQGVYAAALGIILGLVYIWTNSIYCSILMHIIFNFLGSGLQLLLVNNLGEKQAESILGVLNIIYLAMSVFVIPVLIFLWKKNNKDDNKPQPIIRPEFVGYMQNNNNISQVNNVPNYSSSLRNDLSNAQDNYDYTIKTGDINEYDNSHK